MASANHSINFNAVLNAASGNILPLTGICPVSSGVGYVAATTANLAAIGNQVSGIALTQGGPFQVIEYQSAGEIEGALGSGVAGAVSLDANGKLQRGSAGPGPVVGTVNTLGDVVLSLVPATNAVGPNGTSPEFVFDAAKLNNIIADGVRLTGAGTDNAAALQALIDAVPVDISGVVPFPIYLPAGVIFTSQTIHSRGKKLRLVGGNGAGASGGPIATYIMAPPGIDPFIFESFGDTGTLDPTTGIFTPGPDSGGSIVEHVACCGPQNTGGRNFDRLSVGAVIAVGTCCTKSTEQRGYDDFVFRCSTGGTLATTTINSPGFGVLTVNLLPPFPRSWQRWNGDAQRYGYAQGVYANGEKILVNLTGASVPYEFTANSAGHTDTGNAPDARNLSTYQASHTYHTYNGFHDTVNAVVPSAAKWSGYYYYNPAGVITSGAEPAVWGTVVGGTTLDGSGNPWINGGPIWARISGKTTPENSGGTITGWTLTNTTPTYTTAGAGVPVWAAQNPTFGFRVHCIVHFSHIAIDSIQGSAVDCDANAGAGASLNGASLTDIWVTNCAGHGVRMSGADAGGCMLRGVNALNLGGRCISDESSIGNMHEGHQAAVCAGGAYRVTVLGNRSIFDGCYVEGGLAPNEMQGGLTVMEGTLGVDAVSHRSGGLRIGAVNNSYLAQIIKHVVPWGCDPVTFLNFRYNGPADVGFAHDPTTITLYLNDLLTASTDNGLIYQVVGCDVGTSGHLGATEPNPWPTTIGPSSDFHHGTLTIRCVGYSRFSVSLGEEPNYVAPANDSILKWWLPDEANFPNAIMRSAERAGFYAVTHSSVTSNASQLIPGVNARGLHGEVDTGTMVAPRGIELGYLDAAGRKWIPQRAHTFPSTTSYEVGRIVWYGDNSGTDNPSGYVGGILVHSAGGGDTWANFGAIARIASIAMADADQTASTLQAISSIIQTTGLNTANRTLTISNMPAGAERVIDNQCTGAFAIKIAPATGDLNANGIANGKTARIYFDGTNWRRITPDATP